MMRGSPGLAAVPIAWVVWACTIVAASAATLYVRFGSTRFGPSAVVNGWHHMDVKWYVNIARYGYASPAPGSNYAHGKPAFFPMMSGLIWLIQHVVGNWMVAGLIVSITASALVSLLLWRLVRNDFGESIARETVLLLLCFPLAIYLFIPYSESLFLSFVLGTFSLMRRGRWLLAALVCTCAVLTRLPGLFLLAAMAAEWIVQQRGQYGDVQRTSASFRNLVPLGIPLFAFIGWQLYLHAITGRWDSYAHAEALVWGRHIVNPLHALVSTVATAVAFRHSWYLYYWGAEIASVLFGFALTYMLVRRRWFPWAVFVGLNTVALSVSSKYGSGSRAVLTWIPAFILLALTIQKRPQLRLIYYCISSSLMVTFTVSFVWGNWVA